MVNLFYVGLFGFESYVLDVYFFVNLLDVVGFRIIGGLFVFIEVLRFVGFWG